MRIRRPQGWRRALPAAGLVAVGAYLLWNVPSALVASWTRFAAAGRGSRDDAQAALARLRGPAYAAAIQSIRERLPANGEYLLLAGTLGTDKVVRFDLAPRRAIFGGSPKDVASNVTPGKLPTLPKWTVIPSLDPPGPRLVETRLVAGKGALP